MNFTTRVYQLCAKVPRGKVTTYREIARAMRTTAYRAIGQALRRNPYAPKVPCHRVVASDGSIGGFKGRTSGPSIREKIRMLEREGITFAKHRVADFSKRLYRFR